ncbi:GGDEF domain-containing protein [Thalassotalea sediminis]|uniref:GGDEF domain-containing protein n=1 Tax=Thalassotalea sediminis TaxID=1759089 RepID=UPI0025731AB2|nr:GGDEF domain-containing protein [Thalassotalea sediminis]
MKRRTDTTLLEQMKISDVEIVNRMELLGLDNDALMLLSRHKVLIEDQVDAIVDEFYEKQTEIDEISLLIGDADTLMRLRNAQRKYVIDLFSGEYDAEYVNNRLRIGMVHKRIGVEPKLYLSAVKTLKELIVNVLKKHIEDHDEIEKTLLALDNLFYFDTTLVFDTYIDSLVGEIESAKRRTEEYAVSLEKKVAERTKQLEEQAKLDPLTGLYNQRAMQDVLKRELAAVKRRKTQLSLVYIDIDNFKNINDTYGHIKGDEVLKSIGKVVISGIREIDLACRYGGDEFCIILPECDTKNALNVGNNIIGEFNKKYPDFALSLGISSTEQGEPIAPDMLIKLADDNMYKAKKEKGSHVCYG